LRPRSWKGHEKSSPPSFEEVRGSIAPLLRTERWRENENIIDEGQPNPSLPALSIITLLKDRMGGGKGDSRVVARKKEGTKAELVGVSHVMGGNSSWESRLLK